MTGNNAFPLANEPEPVTSNEPDLGTSNEPGEPEPAASNEPVNPYTSIIEQQQEQISALLAQTKSLNDQIVNMVNAGAQFTQQAQQAQQPQQPMTMPALSDDQDWTLEGLASEIGKRE